MVSEILGSVIKYKTSHHKVKTFKHLLRMPTQEMAGVPNCPMLTVQSNGHEEGQEMETFLSLILSHPLF